LEQAAPNPLDNNNCPHIFHVIVLLQRQKIREFCDLSHADAKENRCMYNAHGFRADKGNVRFVQRAAVNAGIPDTGNGRMEAAFGCLTKILGQRCALASDTGTVRLNTIQKVASTSPS
jgi:hypothetical protein